ncbi:MAG: glucose 1-dehydrogenase [bacterium]
MKYLDTLYSLEGRTAIITGASRGIGRAAAISLNSAGANVTLFGRNKALLEETKSLLPNSEKSIIIEGSVNSDSDRKATFASTLEASGRIDILVNNAGIIHRNNAMDYAAKDWDEVIETDLTSVFHWSQDAAKIFRDLGKGKIINLASLLSFSGGVNVVAYAAAKGGISQMTKALANEWAKHHINVNAIAPGYFVTDATDALRKNDQRREHVLSRIPAGRFGEPNELAGAFIFLASHASDYMNGHILTVDGGFNGY